MYKQIVFDVTQDTKADKALTISLLDDVLTKTAAIQPSYILEWANSVKKEPGKTYVMVSAVGAGEYYGSNKNGDFFPEAALLSMQDADEVRPPALSPKPRYKTFGDAKLYRHHKNKPGDPSFGDVTGVFWDYKMHRVVLIIAIDNSTAPDIVKEIRDGKIIAVSMGCKVPFDICSICGNKARKRSDYCKHLTTQMGHIMDDGKKVYAINTKPRFFDISYVTRPAWLGGWQIMKVAESNSCTCSAELAEIKKTAYHDKKGEIFKSEDLPIMSIIKGVSMEEPTIPQHILDELSKYPKQMIWGALLEKGIIPKPNEFSYLMLKDSQPTLAKTVLSKQIVFDKDIEPVDTPETDIIPYGIEGLFDPEFVKMRTFFSPDLDDRLGHYITKEASLLLPLAIGIGLGALYKALRGKLSWAVMGVGATGARLGQNLTSDMQSRLVGTITPAEINALMQQQTKTAGLNPTHFTAIGAFSVPYIYSAYAKTQGKSNIVTKNPGKIGIGALALHEIARKSLRL